MINFTTPVKIPATLPHFTPTQQMLLMGSCFATEMGVRLMEAKFHCDINPYGVLYNPSSIATALREIKEEKRYTTQEIFLHRGLWHSPMHHGDFSSTNPHETLCRINGRISNAHRLMQELDVLLLTWGTAWVYESQETHCVVGNCHKLPDNHFTRRRLSVQEITAEYTALIEELLQQRPQIKVMLTVSPIRHVRDGLHDNQLSKATLLLAADELQHAFPENVCYFPAYEILLDELRDYRFYAEDMVHPSAVATDYVWHRFTESCFSSATRQLAVECAEIGKMLAHKPLHPNSPEYKFFLEQIVLKIDRLNEKYPYLDFQNEKEACYTLLKKLQKS